MTSQEKAKFRARKEWKEFRKSFSKERDALTNSKLTKKFQLHHMNADSTKYTDLSNKDEFLPLNPQSHDFLHFAFTQYRKDPEFISRFLTALNHMIEINKDLDNKSLFR